MKNVWTILAAPILGLVIGWALYQGGFTSQIAWTAGVSFWVAFWWIAEPIPIGATSLIPMAVFPLMGVLNSQEVAQAYGHELILLMLGGFMLSAGMERSGAHRRLALNMVNLFGSSNPRGLVFGFMAASAMISMWISNTATALMLLPIVMAVIAQTENRRLQIALLLGIAYSASVGGIGTPIGTPPNLIFITIYKQTTGIEPSFTQWMSWAMPIVVVMLPLVGFWLTRGLSKIEPLKLPEVGSWRKEEVRTLAVFAITAALWITRKQPLGGWSGMLIDFGFPPNANDASVALLGVIAMFLIPNGKQERLLDWKTARDIPWSILILFASGICIAKAFTESGLSELLGEQLAGIGSLPLVVMVAVICLAVTFLTEVTSNTATTALLMPILAAAAIGAGVDPRMVMFPAVISASFAFMLPAATGPNAIIFGANRISVKEMALEGLVLNLIGVVVVTAICMVIFRSP